MPEAAVDLVVISRQYGAGGSEFAARLAKRLGWGLLDQALVERVAARLHLRAGTVQQRDEQTPGWLTRIASTLMVAPPESPTQFDATDVLEPDCIAHAAHAAIVEAASSPPMVIVGHGAQCIFRDRPGTLAVRLTGSVESRIPRIIARDGGTERDAAARAQRVDGQRQAYVQRYYHHFWGDPLLFDVQFNTGRVSIEDAVSVVASLVLARSAPHQSHAITA